MKQPIRTAALTRLAVQPSGDKGRGVYTNVPIPKGQAVLPFEGPLLRTDQIRDFTHTIQVDQGLFMGPSGRLNDYVNHSCDPSCYLTSNPPELGLVAARDLAAGDEITFDYSTALVEEPPLENCRCGSRNCRGRMLPFHELPAAVKAWYLRQNAVPQFVRDTRRTSSKRAATKAK